MHSETKICQNCKHEFTIEPEDFSFYEKMKVPPPTWCPECRAMRRLTFRNERTLYYRPCDLCGKRTLSMYPDKTSFPVYCHSCYWSDRWDAAAYERQYDFSKPFFEQFKALFNEVPRISVMELMNASSDYANYVYKNKHVYLSYSTLESENVFYSWGADYSTDCFDCVEIQRCDRCYECVNAERCSGSTHLLQSKECINSHFLFDCRNCQNCFMSVNLRNKRYVFKNVQCTKEEYHAKVGEYLDGSVANLERARKEFDDMVRHSLHRYAHIVHSKDSTGQNISDSKNARWCFNVWNCEDLKFSLRCLDERDSMDVFGGGPEANRSYDCLSDGLGSSRLKFCLRCWQNVFDIAYCESSSGASNCFGCVGLRKKSYCILNRQYSKEEYESLLPRVIEHMGNQPYRDAKGRIYGYGEFFPPEISPFAYNETLAQEYFPKTKPQAVSEGFGWNDPESKNYQITKKFDQLPDRIKDVPDSVLDEVIQCAHDQTCNDQCTQAFRIIEPELQFYRRMNFPLPRLCPNCRHYTRLRQRNPMRLWKRRCQCGGDKSQTTDPRFTYKNTTSHAHGNNPCPNEFETSYAPERQEIIYCEQCYNTDVG